MACDRFIRWEDGDELPSKDWLAMFLEDYFGDAGAVAWDEDRFFISLPGSPTNPFGRVAPMMTDPDRDDKRWIEVWLGLEDDESARTGPCIDVITRQQDRFTNALANDVAQMIANYWKGSLEV